LGIFEAGLFPGLNFFLTGWYRRVSPSVSTLFPPSRGSFFVVVTRHKAQFRMKLTWQEEINKRVAVFFGGAVLAGAFGGIFGYALSRMAGVGGLNGWQWIFIMEGMFPEVACRQQTDIQGSSRWLSELPHSGWCKIGPIKLNS
jgi:hypothetical protein